MILLSMLLKTSVMVAVAALVERTAARRASAAVRKLDVDRSARARIYSRKAKLFASNARARCRNPTAFT